MDNILQKSLFGKGLIPIYSRLADLASTRQKVVASNIANVNTEGYEKRQIDFDKELRKAIDKPSTPGITTHPQHIPLGNSPDGAPKIERVKKTDNDTGMNSVDIDEEMANLAQTQIIFEFGADMLARKFKALKSAIRGSQ
ncbi:MAG: flagellar basal body rod protein FlgB [Candidatus Zixiibacteriota bacterium]